MMKRKGDEELENWYKAFKLRAFEVIKKFKLFPFDKKIKIGNLWLFLKGPS